MPNKFSNHYFYQVNQSLINYSSDQIVMILMASGFVFNEDTHSTYINVQASELADGNGYARKSKVMTGVLISNDNLGNQSEVTWDNVSWAASGGAIGPSPGAIIIDTTTADDTVIGFIDFLGDQTASDGSSFTVTAPLVRLNQC